MITSRSFVATVVGAALAGLLASACAPASPGASAAAAAEAESRSAQPASAGDAAPPASAPPTLDTPAAAAQPSPAAQPTVQPRTLAEADAQVAARMLEIQSQIDASVAAAEASRLARPSQAAAPNSDNTAPDASGNVP